MSTSFKNVEDYIANVVVPSTTTPTTPTDLVEDLHSEILQYKLGQHMSSSSLRGGGGGGDEDDRSTSSTLSAASSMQTFMTCSTMHDDMSPSEAIMYRQQLKDVNQAYNKLKVENQTLVVELESIKREMEELQDQFRLDDADEFRQLQAELEIATKNCRIFQFKLRKLEKRNDALESDKVLLQDKLDDALHDINKVHSLEEELLIAKEVSIRLHSELEQTENWRNKTERLNKDLKYKIDELKDQMELEIRNRNLDANDMHPLILIERLYESMYNEYILQEQLTLQIPVQQANNDRKELREVTDLLNSYQHKFVMYNEEINHLKHENAAKDKILDQVKLQLKNLKRSRSLESSDRQKRNANLDNAAAAVARQQRSASVDPAQALNRQVDIAYDEIRLLKNKISRLEDDLQFVTQERDCLSTQLDKIEDKAMKTFSTSIEVDHVHVDDDDVDDIDLDSIVAKQMAKKKFDKVNRQNESNDDSSDDLNRQIGMLQELTNNLKSNGRIIDLHDNDKQISELKTALDDLYKEKQLINNELGMKTIELDAIKDLVKTHETRNNELNESLMDKTSLIESLKRTIDQNETTMDTLKKNNQLLRLDEVNLTEKLDKLNTALSICQNDLNDKLNSLERLKNENNELNERIRTHLLHETTKFTELIESNELSKSMIKQKDTIIAELNDKLATTNDKYRQEYMCLEQKYLIISKDLDSKCHELYAEINRLNIEKETMNADLNELRLRQQSKEDLQQQLTRPLTSESDDKKLSDLQIIAIKAKYESKYQYYELEMNSLKSKCAKLVKEKLEQEKTVHDMHQANRDLMQKYKIDSDAWNRQKKQFSEKEKMYDESIEVRKELRTAADKLRQKLQSVEEQINDKQNKFTIDKHNWETQRLQLVSTVNRLEEQLSKYKVPKKSYKKELEFVWDKERKELHYQIQTIQITMKNLQSQLAQRTSNHSIGDPSNVSSHSQDAVQSIQGENEFLKNRIKELEIMLDETEHVKRFLIDLKEAYESDKTESFIAREDFHQQIEARDRLMADYDSKINFLLNEFNKLNGEPVIATKVPAVNKIKRDFPKPINTRTSSTMPQVDKTMESEDDEENLENASTKWLFTSEFNQMFKKLERVKDNFNTHKKFMDIVKLKSAKMMQNKSSLSSLQVNEMYQINKPELRGSVPPADNRIKLSSLIPKRAKSVSKEPNSLDLDGNTATTAGSLKSVGSSRFFSLTRRFPKLRFATSSSQVIVASTSDHPAPIPNPSSNNHNKPKNADKGPSSSLRERAMSPSKLFKTLRSRSPFAKNTMRTARSQLCNTLQQQHQQDTTSANNDKQLPTNNVINPIMTSSCHSTLASSDKTSTLLLSTHNQPDATTTRSISCEFIESNNNVESVSLVHTTNSNSEASEPDQGGGGGNTKNVLPLANRTLTTQRMRKVTLNKTDPDSTGLVATSTSGLGDTNPKCVKFKDVVNNSQHQQSDRMISPQKTSDQEQLLINALDEAMLITSARTTSTLTPSSSYSLSLNDETTDKKHQQQQSRPLAVVVVGVADQTNNSATLGDDTKPPKPPVVDRWSTTTTPNRVKFASIKSRTIDVPDFLQQQTSTTTTNAKPITSILRRSETPPNTKTVAASCAGGGMRQASVESTESNSRDRESSIERRLRINTSSASRPLMFNNN